MKLVILDYFKRRWQVLVSIFAAYFIIEAWAVADGSIGLLSRTNSATETIGSTMSNALTFPLIIFLGTFLMMDTGLGYTRILSILPLKAQKIGRSLWLASVALPALGIALFGALALSIFSNHQTIHWTDHLTKWVHIALVLGGVFGGLTLRSRTLSYNFFGRVKTMASSMLSALALFGWIFMQVLQPTLTQSILLFIALAALSVIGWFRAEQMVLQRASFKLVAPASSKKPAQHKIPQGFGGLRYLAQRSFILSTLLSLALFGWMTFAMSFIHVSDGQSRAQAIASAINGGSTPWFFFILIFSIVPMVFQLRVLRTFPIPSSALAATLVFLPILSIAAVAVIVTTLAISLAGQAVMLQTINSFLMIGAKAAIMVAVIVWRGLDALTYFLVFLLLVADSFVSLGVTMIFHLGSKSPEQPWWIALAIFLLSAAASVALTQKLLTQSSDTYRVRTMPASAWSLARR